MSGGNDSVFARWSRRKLSSRSTEAPREDGNENLLADAGAEDVGAAAQAATQEEEPPAQDETDEPGEPVPRIEDLTAESDLSAFLRKGVPKALKSAALRKIWSLDPAIRDYVGPSEYAWNFNEPGSMPGFGPLDATETVVDFLSKAARAIEAGAAETASSEPSPAKPPGDTAIQKPANISHPDADAAEAGETAELLAPRSPAARADRTMAAKEGQTVQPSRQEGSFRPRHGGAMPR